MSAWSLHTSSPEETTAFGRLLGSLLPCPALVLLEGDLGAGKTRLIQGLALGAGVPEDEPVTSPSYTLMNMYTGRCLLYHFDLYRLAGPDDLVDLGFEDYLEGDGITVVEWAGRVPRWDADALILRLGVEGPQERRIALEGSGREYEELSQRLQAAWEQRGRK